MELGAIILLAIALSVDSMAVSLSGSVSLGRLRWTKVLYVGGVLAAVQAAFFATGYLAGDAVSHWVEKWGCWIGFALLMYVGGSMMAEAVRKTSDEEKDFSSLFKLFLAAVATSIDAVASGASFGITGMDAARMWLADAMIFVATVIFAALGMVCGSAAGRTLGRPAGFAAGIVLIVIAVTLVI